MSLVPVDKMTGKKLRKPEGEGRDASRVRDSRDHAEAVRKGYDNQALRERGKR